MKDVVDQIVLSALCFCGGSLGIALIPLWMNCRLMFIISILAIMAVILPLISIMNILALHIGEILAMKVFVYMLAWLGICVMVAKWLLWTQNKSLQSQSSADDS